MFERRIQIQPGNSGSDRSASATGNSLQRLKAEGHGGTAQGRLPARASGNRDQEQIQIIATARGRPKPNVPSIVNASSKSKFASRGVVRDDMTQTP
jgi:hypothetical protein